jgi:hypothetical protein
MRKKQAKTPKNEENLRETKSFTIEIKASSPPITHKMGFNRG